MPITSFTTDPQALTLTIVAEFPVTVDRLWEAYADPRQLERFWGPPSWPATFYRHDMAVGGRSHYAMHGPDGQSSAAYWEFLEVEPGRSFTVHDGFANADWSPDPDMPDMRASFRFEATQTGSRLTTTTWFPSAEALERLLAMGIEEGTRQAMGQIDDVLADLAALAAGRGTQTQLLSDTRVRISRIVRGDVDQVWRAHHEPELLQRWLLGPDGWEMPVCEVAAAVGDSYRYAWVPVGGGDGGFGFEGELLASDPPRRSVTTERMVGTSGPSTLNELTLTPCSAGTLLTLVVTYPSAEVRDLVLGTGMTTGMETSYQRLEGVLAA